MPDHQSKSEKKLLNMADARRTKRPKSGPVGPIPWDEDKQTKEEWKAMLVLAFWMTLLGLLVIVIVAVIVEEIL